MSPAGVYMVSLFTETPAPLSHLVSFLPLNLFKSLYKFQGQDFHLYILIQPQPLIQEFEGLSVVASL